MTGRNNLVIRFEGSAGDGILSMGTIIARAAARSGFHACTLSSFLAEVRGGQSTFQLQLARHAVGSPGDSPDVVVALNHQAVDNQLCEIGPGCLMLRPADVEVDVGAGVALGVDFNGIAVQATGAARGKNLVAIGVLGRIIGLDAEILNHTVQEVFAKKSTEVVEAAVGAAAAGARIGAERANELAEFRLEPSGAPPRLLLSGNEAVGLGALVAGVRYFSGYPITPASEIMEVLAKHLPKLGGRAVQAEDEIAALGMCLGAAFGGKKALTSTSGPGLSLMTELLGLAAMSQLGVVVVNVQRAGPSTGMPTKDAQGDLSLAVHGAHGEAPRVVIAPQSVADCFADTVTAVNTAHEFQVPVIVLSSQSISHRMQTVDLPALEQIRIYEEPLFDGDSTSLEEFARFRQTDEGKPLPRSIPGTPNGMYRTSGLEHDETGHPTFEPEARVRMVAQRRRRMDAVRREVSERNARDALRITGHPVSVVAWGGTAGAAREALHSLDHKGIQLGYYFPRVLWPLPTDSLRELLKSGTSTLLVCEVNDSQQLAALIRSELANELREFGISVIGINKDDGNPFTKSEIEHLLRPQLSADFSRIRAAV